MRHRHGNRLLLAILVASLCLVSAACRGSDAGTAGVPGATAQTGAAGGASAASTIKNPDRLVMASGYLPSGTFDPAANYWIGEGALLFNIYDTLIFYDGESAERFIPWLATQVPTTDNGLARDGGKTYAFPIRAGVKFQEGPVDGPDGQTIPGSGDLSPEDVAYTFQRGMLADPPGGPQWMLLQPLLGVTSILDLARRIEEDQGGKKAADLASLDDVSPATLDAVCQAVKDAVQVDGDQVVFHLREPYVPFLQLLVGSWGSVLDREWVAAEVKDASGKVTKKAGWDGDCSTWRKFYGLQTQESELYRATNGTGPYRLTRWVADDGLTLTRNDGFWKGPGHLKEIVWKATPEFSTRLLMFQNGDADLLEIPLENADQVQPLVDQGVLRKVVPTGSRMLWVMKFNEKVNPENNGFIGTGKLDGEGIPPDFFGDIDVRKGFSYAFDVDAFLRDRLLGDAVRSNGPIPSGTFGYDPTWQRYEYDLGKAAEHFKKAFGGKLWDTGFTMVVMGDPIARSMFQSALAQINPKFRISTEDQQAAKNLADQHYDMEPLQMLGWMEDFHDPDDWAYPLLGKAEAERLDFPPQVAQQLDDLIGRGRTEQDLTRRAAIYSQIGRIAYESAVELFHTEPRTPTYEPAYLKGVVRNPAYWGIYYRDLYKSND